MDPQATAADTATGDATAIIAEDEAAVKVTETDAAEPVVKSVLPTTQHDPTASAPARPTPTPPSPTGAAPAATGDRPDAADHAQFVERVAGAFRAAGQGDGTVRMRLHPPELGSLRLEVSVRDGALSARLETDTPEARTMLLDNLPALRDRLAQQDIKIERFEVSCQNGSGGSPSGAEDHTAPREGFARHAPRDALAEPEAPRSPRSARAIQPGAGLHLDVMV
jgi:flagellar hook-length control protein FliK